MPAPRAFAAWVLRRTAWWVLGTLLVGGLIEVALSGAGAYRAEVPLGLAVAVASLNLSGSMLAWVLVRLFRRD